MSMLKANPMAWAAANASASAAAASPTKNPFAMARTKDILSTRPLPLTCRRRRFKAEKCLGIIFQCSPALKTEAPAEPAGAFVLRNAGSNGRGMNWKPLTLRRPPGHALACERSGGRSDAKDGSFNGGRRGAGTGGDVERYGTGCVRDSHQSAAVRLVDAVSGAQPHALARGKSTMVAL